MADVNTTLAALERGRENCARIYLLVQEVITTRDQASIDAIVAAATNNSLTPKPTGSLDGQSFQWQQYSESLLQQIDKLTDLIAKLSGPFEIRTVGRGW